MVAGLHKGTNAVVRRSEECLQIIESLGVVGQSFGQIRIGLAKRLAEDTQGFDDLKTLFASKDNGISALMETSYRKGLHALIAGWPA